MDEDEMFLSTPKLESRQCKGKSCRGSNYATHSCGICGVKVCRQCCSFGFSCIGESCDYASQWLCLHHMGSKDLHCKKCIG